MKLSDLVIKEAYQGVRPKWAKPILYDEKGEMIQMANRLRLPWNTIQQAFLKAELTTLESSIWKLWKIQTRPETLAWQRLGHGKTQKTSTAS